MFARTIRHNFTQNNTNPHKYAHYLQTIQDLNQKSNPKHKEQNLPQNSQVVLAEGYEENAEEGLAVAKDFEVVGFLYYFIKTAFLTFLKCISPVKIFELSFLAVANTYTSASPKSF